MNSLNQEEKEQIYANILKESKPDRYFYVMVILSCTVATYGLLSNSTAVVIGAMLIAPLMGPILGGALGIALNSNEVFKVSAKAEVLGSITAILLSALLTLVLPQSELTSEIIARTAPTILDLVIALASGAAGTYAICKKPGASTLPGVAIATALMPPLCVVGIGLAKQDFGIVMGALLLFLANMIAIDVAAIFLFELFGFSRNAYVTDINRKTSMQNRMAYPVLLLIIVSIPLSIIMWRTYRSANIDKIVNASLTDSIESMAPQSTLISTDYAEVEGRIDINAAFRTTKVMKTEDIRQMENLLELKLGKPISINADIVLVQKINNKESNNSFLQLLPVQKETKTVEVEYSKTPENIIKDVINEKISLMKNYSMDDFKFTYTDSTGTYIVTIDITGPANPDDNFRNSIQSILEERLKRRVDIKIKFSIAEQESNPSNSSTAG